LIFWVALAAGLGAGFWRGGGLEPLGGLRVRGLVLPLLGGGLHVLLRVWPGAAALPGGPLAASLILYAAIAAFLLCNLRLTGAPLALAGMSANFAATAWAGGRMPVWTGALWRIPPRVSGALLHGALASHAAMAHPAGLGWLGDILPAPPPLPPDVISVGDLCIALALALFVARAMGRRGRRPPRPT